MLTVWAGKKELLKRLQWIIDRFVWAGRTRVRGSTTAFPKEEGSLNLLGVEAQYNALTGKFMLWIMKDEVHSLCSILQHHIQEASGRRWRLSDLTWIVSQCGAVCMSGSAPWRVRFVMDGQA